MGDDVWYIVKQANGQCELVSTASGAEPPQPAHPPGDAQPGEQWGPFSSRSEAIARRVGLIRAGKCQPQ